MNAKELSTFMQSFANEQGLTKDTIEALVISAFSQYASKKYSDGKGTFVARFEGDNFVIYRVWELIEDAGEMTDTEKQWRVMDAVDEGFDDAEPGDCVEIEAPTIEYTRQFKDWLHQFLMRNIPKPIKRST